MAGGFHAKAVGTGESTVLSLLPKHSLLILMFSLALIGFLILTPLVHISDQGFEVGDEVGTYDSC